jgi:hypothetical protein
MDGMKFPADKDMPPEILGIKDLQGIDLSHAKWDRDIEMLTHQLERLLSGQAHAVFSRAPLPPIVPHLCDRIDHQMDAVDFFQDQADMRTPVVIVRGHRWEEHYGFLDRLRYLRILDELLGVRALEVGVRSVTLEWSAARIAEGKYDRVLRTAINGGVVGLLTASDEALRAHMQALPQPLVLTLQITWDDVTRCGDGVFGGFLGAWRRLFGGKGAGGTVELQPAYPVVLWMNVSYDAPAQHRRIAEVLARLAPMPAGSSDAVESIDSSMSLGPGVGALRPLAPVGLGDVETWMMRDDVRPYVEGQQPSVRALLEDATRGSEGGRMPMGRFVLAVRGLLDQRGERGGRG